MINDKTKTVLEQLRQLAQRNETKVVYKKLISILDATTLSPTDSSRSVKAFVHSVQQRTGVDGIPFVASICVAPQFIEDVGIMLGDDTEVVITSVAGGFPLSHTFLEVKMLECAMAVESGADEIDVVIDLGEILEGDVEVAASEIASLRDEIGGEVVMKVIIESGELKSDEMIRRATRAAIAGGADFVKTSTGKTSVSATPEAVAVMCEEIMAHFVKTGDRVGIKIAGGISSVSDAVNYYTLVEELLGREWLTPELMRIGSSSLLDKLLTMIK